MLCSIQDYIACKFTIKLIKYFLGLEQSATADAKNANFTAKKNKDVRRGGFATAKRIGTTFTLKETGKSGLNRKRIFRGRD